MDFGGDLKWPQPQPADLVRLDDPGILWALSEVAGYGSTGYEPYRPMDEPTLFRAFAAITEADEALAFFRAYGPLLADYKACLHYTRRDDYRESVQLWRSRALVMDEAVRLFDAVHTKDVDAAGVLLRDGLPDDPRRALPGRLEDLYVPFGIRHFAQDPALEGLSLFEQAEHCIAAMVNDNLLENVGPELVYGQAGAASLDLRPVNLLGAMWLMFTRAVLGQVIVQPCSHCGGWFAMSPGSARRGRMYCADTCKMAAHRDRTRPESQTERVETKKQGGDRQ